MKSILIIWLLAFAVAFTSCGKKVEVKQEVKKDEKKEVVIDDVFKGLKYSSEMLIDDWQVGNSLVNDTGGLCLGFFIYINEKDTTLYDVCKDKFKDKYPLNVDVEPNSKSNRAMVLLPNYLTVNVSGYGTTSGAIKEYDKPETLKKLLALFDFDGLSKLPKENIKGNDLVKFMPKFESKQKQ